MRRSLAALALLACAGVAHATTVFVISVGRAAALFGTAQGFIFPTLNAYAVDQVEPAQLGRAQTTYNGAFNLGVTLGSLALGPVVHAVGYRPTFAGAAVVAVLALALFAVDSVRKTLRADRARARAA